MKAKNVTMIPLEDYQQLVQLAKDHWSERNLAESRAAVYKQLLREALEKLPARGSLRRRIRQAIA